MKGKDLLIGLSYISPKYIEEAENDTISPASGRKLFRRPLLVAAIIALMLLLVGCGVVYVLKMQNMKIGEQEVAYDVFDYDPDSGEAVAYVGKDTMTQQVLTLTGLKGTPSYQATQEWFAFKREYDPDYAISEAMEEDPITVPEVYEGYYPYTQVMMDKIDEIAAKYDLNLMGDKHSLHNGRLFYEEAGIDSLLVSDSSAVIDVQHASIYEGGSMQLSLFFMKMPEEAGQWPVEMTNCMYYTPKDCFSPYTMEIGDLADWQEWNYTTASGYNVLLLRSGGLCWIICDREDAMISYRLDTRSEWYSQEPGGSSMTDRQLERIADAFDFSIEPKFTGMVTSFDGVDPTNPVQTQNGYTIEVKDVISDGLIDYITLGITAPDGVDLTRSVIDDGREVIPRLGGGAGELAPKSGEDILDSGGSYMLDDGDGLGNTHTVILEIVARRKGENSQEPAIEKGDIWTLYWEDLVAEYYSGSLLGNVEFWRAEGYWQFDIHFDKGDFREFELIREPVTMNTVVGWTLQGEDVYEDVTLKSFTLRSLSATAEFEDQGGDLTDYQNERYVTVVLKDGSEIRLQQTSQAINVYQLQAEREIPLDEVDHVRLADGTKLEMP